jgi:hypothetical protein
VHPISRPAGLAVLALLGAALYWTIRLQHADWLFVRGDTVSLREAVRLAPENAEYAGVLAQSEPARAVAILRTAAARNPRNSSVRIQLGLAEEQLGDFGPAEAHLLEAARLDTGFAPRWALSDFYFHRRDSEKFWPAVNATLSAAYGDVTEQFNQCWTLTSDAATILARAIPERPFILRQYLEFLLHSDRLDAAAPVAAKVLASADREAAPLLLAACDRDLSRGRTADALSLWNGLAQRNLIPYPGIAPGRGLPVNGEFRVLELGHGFDWRLSLPAGVFAERPGLTLRFSGRQPESADLLSQYFPLAANRSYALTIRYRTTGIASDSGLHCRVLEVEIPLPGGDGDREETLRFRTSTQDTLGQVVLFGRRVPGTVRIKGSLVLEKFALREER